MDNGQGQRLVTQPAFFQFVAPLLITVFSVVLLKDEGDAGTKGYAAEAINLEDDEVDEPFDVWNEDMSVLSINKNHATLEDIANLESASQRKFPIALQSFWQELGTFGGEINIEQMTIKLPSVGEFLPNFNEDARPYEKLSDLGLISYMNYQEKLNECYRVL